jgi:hypothetical protein
VALHGATLAPTGLEVFVVGNFSAWPVGAATIIAGER